VEWHVHDGRPVYQSTWVEVWLNDVEVAGGDHLEHHELRFPRASTTAVVVDDRRRVLLLWRHRFITNTWGWEVPAGWTDAGEEPETAIRREIEEETGWRAATIVPMIGYNAISGIGDMCFTAFLATDLTRIGEPADKTEASRVEWHPLADVPKLAADGQITDGPSLTALSYYLGMYCPRPPELPADSALRNCHSTKP
jgi:8-oxo-dGTP pyrophosphatase MutT (NUDIX family)